MTATAPNPQSRTTGLSLEPLDVLFFRDGRPYGAALDGQSRFPLPQTFAGAIRTYLLREAGCDFDRLKEGLAARMPLDAAIDAAGGPGWVGRMSIRGPWLARLPDQDQARKQPEVLVPMPSTIHRLKGQGGGDAAPGQGRKPDPLLRLDPLSPGHELPGWRPERPGMRPLWLLPKARTERAGGFLTPDGLRAFLAGQAPGPEDVLQPKDLYAFDRRTGIGIDPDRLSAQESLIYTASFLALKPGVGWYLEIVLPDDAPADPFSGAAWLALGGEGRQAKIECVERFPWPEPPQASGKGTLLLLTTPAVFEAGWCPNCLANDGRLVAASVPAHVPVSGWDLARGGPKPARFAVPAGSVYFLSNPVDPLPPGSLADKVEDAREGWGCYLKGAWNYAGNQK